MNPTTVDLVLDATGLHAPIHLGQAHVQPSGQHGVRIRVSLSQQEAGQLRVIGMLDPDFREFAGDHFPRSNRPIFGCLQDISPDRWGRRLLDRRRAQEIRQGRSSGPARLNLWDYLLGIDDRWRLGALRLRSLDGGWLQPPGELNVPPMAMLRKLEASVRLVEDDPDGQSDDEVRLLVAPGSSLGGARPKATVIDAEGRLWIAKFPSSNDADDIGLWEALTNALARKCGISVPDMRAQRLGGAYHVAQSLRFDRTVAGERYHVASAMTLTGHQDGDGASTGVSYLELSQVLMQNGATPNRCLPELWRRIVFNMLVSNADDHLRNHAFILRPGIGWELAPAYDMNPMPDASELALNVSEHDNVIDLELARSVAMNFRVGAAETIATIEKMKSVVREWRSVAMALGRSKASCDRMANAFRLAET